MKQQRLADNSAAVSETLDAARGFISETEATINEVDVLVQVKLDITVLIQPVFFKLGSKVRMESFKSHQSSLQAQVLGSLGKVQYGML